MRNSLKFAALTAGAIALSGCTRRLASQSAQPAYVPPPPPRIMTPPPGAVIVPGQPPGYPGSVPPPPGSFPTSPPAAGGFPTAPPTSAVPPPPGGFPTAPSAPPPPTGFPTAPPPGPTSQFPTAPPTSPPAASAIPNDVRDRVGFGWRPDAPSAPPLAQAPVAPPQTKPLAPPAGPKVGEPPMVLLLPPTKDESPAAKSETPRQLYPPTPEPPATSPLPVGIAGYDRARDNVSTGQRPTLEGLDWLQKSGVRTVVFLHLPGETVDADRQQVEKRGMNFVAIEINPRDLSRDSIERFLKVQTDHRTEKLFVYDLDGSLAGAMWYLSFRILDQDSEEVARIKASSLGQAETRDSARDAWQAARKYLEGR